jgi:hypothetical protein
MSTVKIKCTKTIEYVIELEMETADDLAIFHEHTKTEGEAIDYIHEILESKEDYLIDSVSTIDNIVIEIQ